MPEPKRVVQEIVIDSYTSDDRALSWYYHLEENLRFPFWSHPSDSH